MAKEKRQHCEWCGEFLGEYPSTYGVPESCGAAECERELRAMERERDAEAEERGREDGFERYR